HDRDHLDDLALRLTHDEDAAARKGAHKAFLLQEGHRLADRRAADAEPLREPPLVEPDLLPTVVDVHRGDRPVGRPVGLIAIAGLHVQPRRVDRGPVWLFYGAREDFGHASGIWYTRALGKHALASRRDTRSSGSRRRRPRYSAAARFGVTSSGR